MSFAPYLDDLAARLNHQYLLTFLAKAEKKAGRQRFKVESNLPNAELLAPDQVFVPTGPQE